MHESQGELILRNLSIIAILAFSVIAPRAASAQQQYPFQDSKLPAEERVDNLLSLLTLQEKIDLLGMTLNVPRLGVHGSGTVLTIPGSNGQFEGLHGVAIGGVNNWGKRAPGSTTGKYPGTSSIPTTQFPEPSGLGETWDRELVQKVAAEEGYETRFVFQSYDRGGLIIRAPNTDLGRDPRWGRVEESFGEDPYFAGTMATAFVKGLQGTDPHYWLTASLLKHFMANSNEDTRTSSSSNFDTVLLHEYYAEPFRIAVEQGGANAIMASYNAVNGIPMTASPLLKKLLIKQWGFNGIIDTDRDAVTNMVTKFKYYPDMDHAVAGALLAGVNQFLNPYEQWIQEDLKNGLITEKDIDNNVKGVLRVLLRLGSLDKNSADPYLKIREGVVPTPWETPAAKDLALRATEESIVLLKNAPAGGSAPLLPLKASEVKSIAVVGPRADEVDGDGYGGTPPFAITPLAGIRTRAGEKIAIRYAADHDKAVELARNSTLAIVVIGNTPRWVNRTQYRPDDGKEAVDRKQITLNTEQQKLVEDVYAANPRTIVVLVSGFPYAIDWSERHIPAILHMAPCSEEEGQALANVLFGDYNPAGRVAMTWPQSVEQLPPMMDYNIRDGRTYMYFKGQPLYPFGYGLSYTRFRYSGMRLNSTMLHGNGKVTVSVKVANTGARAGDEVVQMYIRYIDSKVQRPLKQLVGFQRISLDAGQTKNVTFQLSAKSLAYWSEDGGGKWKVEHDRVCVLVGGSSDDIAARRVITVVP